MTLRYDREREEILVGQGGGNELRDDILDLVRREIAAEREACAQLEDQASIDLERLANEMPAGSVMRFSYEVRATDASDRAAAIRARGEQTD